MDQKRFKSGLKKIGANMRRYRRGQHISQRAVAAAIGGSQSRVSRWEQGGSSPRLEDFLRYADAISTRPELLIAGTVLDSVEQLAHELDPAASEVVTCLVQMLHERRPSPAGATTGAAV